MTNTLVNATNLTKNAESDFSTEGNMPVMESQLMSIDMSKAAFIMESLTNLYSDPYLSVIREYVANAIDSHIEAGNTDPVEVSAPSQWSPNLIIKDQGIGMSREDVFRYGNYGSSDKRDNLEVVGNFGMGSKSAMAITNSFTITAVKDGEFTMATIGRNDDGHGQVDIIVNETTTEPNGVTITIPITTSNIWSVRSRIDSVISKLPAGRVSVDGVVNSDFRDDLTKISDDVHVQKINLYDTSASSTDIHIITGGFGYVVDRSFVYDISDTVDFDLFGVPDAIFIDVPNGSVDLTPSREQLRMTSRTKRIITDSTVATLREIASIYTKKMDDVETFEDAYSIIEDLGYRSITERIISRCDNLVVPEPSDLITFEVINGNGEYTSKNTSKLNWALVEMISRSEGNKFIVLEKDKDYSEKSSTSRIRKFLNQVTDDYSSNTPVFVLNPDFEDENPDDKDTLYRYIKRSGTEMKLTEIYAEVNEYNKRNRTYSGGSVATGRGDDAIIKATAYNGETYKTSNQNPTSGSMAEHYKDLFDNKLPIVYIANNTKASGKDFLVQDVCAHMAVREICGAPANIVVIRGSNRKPAYFAKRGIDVMTVAEYLESTRKFLSSDVVVDALRMVATYQDHDELSWSVRRNLGYFESDFPEYTSSVGIIRDELSPQLGADVEKMSRYIANSIYGVRQFIFGVQDHIGNIPELTKLYEELEENDNDDEYQDRGNLVNATLSACTQLFRYGHKDEGYAMLETLVNLLTNKEED